MTPRSRSTHGRAADAAGRGTGLAVVLALAGLVGLAGCQATPEGQASQEGQAAQEADEAAEEMGFFITSRGAGSGADLGGLEGADAHCQELAAAVGAGHRTWRAYLSTQATDDEPAVHARDRIGEGPWHNAEGQQIAADVEDLHYNNAAINYDHALDENGERVASGPLGGVETRHDILTGSRLDGTAFPPGEDRTCSNWTSDGEGAAMVGHHDRYRFDTFGSPWNSAHPTRGCGTEDLAETGSAGLLYCFAAG